MSADTSERKYQRVLLKLSGEAFAAESGFGIGNQSLDDISREITEVHAQGYDVAVVVGGGNIVRGERTSLSANIERTTADYMGMMGTVINALALRAALQSRDVDARVMSALALEAVCECYVRGRAMAHLAKKRVLILSCGTGNPYFTTDTAAALRAAELDCDVLVKATTVDGIYDKDPKKTKEAQHLKKISYRDILTKDLRIMDHAAVTLARDSKIPVLVCSFSRRSAIKDVLSGQGKFSIIHE